MKEVYNIELVQFNENYHLELERRAVKTTQIYGSIKPPRGIFYLVWVDEDPVGMGGLYRNNYEIAEIKRMYIKPTYRGYGFGKKLVKLLIEEARFMNIKIIRLDTMKHMSTAHSLYRSFGFEERGPYSLRIKDELKPYYLFMELQL